MKMKKLLCIVLIVLCIVMVASTCFAASEIKPEDISGTANVDMGGVKTFGDKLATIIRSVGVVVAVIVIMVLGIKYMMGSAQEKAEYKKTMIPYLVGAVLLFGATTIAGAVIDFSTTQNNPNAAQQIQDERATQRALNRGEEVQ